MRAVASLSLCIERSLGSRFFQGMIQCPLKLVERPTNFTRLRERGGMEGEICEERVEICPEIKNVLHGGSS